LKTIRRRLSPIAGQNYTLGRAGKIGNEYSAPYRSCTLIAKPITMKVAMSDASPALINGNGTPMTGKIPGACQT
jgi:hypothetical protein